MIFWPARSYSPSSPDSAFDTDIMYFGNQYFNVHDGSLDMIDITAWNFTPRVMVPEFSPPAGEYPFTWAFLEFYDAYIDSKDNHVYSSQEIQIPRITSLSPNSSNSEVEIQFYSPNTSSSICLEAFDISGRLILNKEFASAYMGENTFTWDARDSNGKAIPPGVYFIHITLDGQTSTATRLLVVE